MRTRKSIVRLSAGRDNRLYLAKRRSPWRPRSKPYALKLLPMCSEWNYPFHDQSVLVTRCGRIRTGGRKINFSTVFAGQHIGIRAVANGIRLVSFMESDPGLFDYQENRVGPMGKNPFTPKPLPMCPEWTQSGMVGRIGFEPMTKRLKAFCSTN